MNSRRRLLVLSVYGFAVLLLSLGWTRNASAQTPGATEPVLSEDLLLRVQALESELRDLRQQAAATNAPRPSGAFGLVSRRAATFAESSYYDSDETAELASPHCNGSPCSCQSECNSCKTPLAPAPCVECPRVSTLRPFNNVHIFGALKMDMLFSQPRALSPGSPFFLFNDSLTGRSQDSVSIHARQSTLAAAFTGPQFGGFQSGGTIVTLFFNDAVVVDQYGILPLQAFGELKNENWRFAAGLQFDVFSPGLPTVLPFSALAASGNSGNSFRGQIRLERFIRLADDVQWTLQGALSDPINSTIDPTFRISEDNGWPNVEARVALGLGCIEGAGLAATRPFEVGVSGVVGQLRTTDPTSTSRVVADVWGLGSDFRWKMTDRFGVAGEVYTGQTLGTYNAGILQNLNLDTFAGVRSSGGWIETFYYWTPALHSHIGAGIDDPIDRDISNAVIGLGRTLNRTLFGNLIWDVNEVFRVGLELTWRKTNYKILPDNQGPAVHTQLQWAF